MAISCGTFCYSTTVEYGYSVGFCNTCSYVGHDFVHKNQGGHPSEASNVGRCLTAAPFGNCGQTPRQTMPHKYNIIINTVSSSS